MEKEDPAAGLEQAHRSCSQPVEDTHVNPIALSPHQFAFHCKRYENGAITKPLDVTQHGATLGPKKEIDVYRKGHVHISGTFYPFYKSSTIRVIAPSSTHKLPLGRTAGRILEGK